jgi:hypothetical protein
MLLILLSWIYILFTTTNLGFGLDKIIKLKQNNFAITSILGLISTTILASVWAFFGRINIEFHVFLLVLNCLLFLKFRSEIRLNYQLFVEELKNLKVPLQLFLGTITILIIAQCSTAPYVIDNESYYIQTIKWLNEYGYVKGLANLHIFFGQTSGWHILQSAFNFSFLYPNFNDLSGFCLLLGNLFAIFKLNSYFTNENKNYLIVGLMPLANLFFFQFISAPSPDLPVYILTFILFYYFIKDFSKTTIESFNMITILVFFIIFIKPIFFPFLVYPIVLLFFNYQNLYKKLLSTTVIGVLFGVILLSKNIIITGFPLFPLTNFQFIKFDFSVPKDVANFYFNDARLYRFFVTNREFHTLTTFQIATKWLFASKINALFNLLTIAVMAISPAIIYKFYNKKSIWIIYLVTVIQMFFLIFSSPIFRFFIHLTLFFIFLIFASWLPLKKYIMSAYTFCTIIIFVILFVPISFSGLTKNKLISKNSNFSIQNIIFPHNNTKTEMQYEVVEKGNLKYNSPINNTFFWRTGNGELPCVNKEQLDYFANYLSVYPQMRTSELKDGFYAKRIVPNE